MSAISKPLKHMRATGEREKHGILIFNGLSTWTAIPADGGCLGLDYLSGTDPRVT